MTVKDQSASVEYVKKIHRYALQTLARRDYSQAELHWKLRQRFADNEKIAEVIQALLQAGHLDDLRFSKTFVRYKSDRNFGPTLIRQQLRQKGVDEHLLECVDNGEIDWFCNARQLLAKRLRGKRVTVEVIQQQRRYLYQRGFDLAQIDKICREIKVKSSLDTY